MLFCDTVAVDEMMTAMSHRALINEDERLFHTFQDLDKNGDGCISREELDSALKKVLGIGIGGDAHDDFSGEIKEDKRRMYLNRVTAFGKQLLGPAEEQIDVCACLSILNIFYFKNVILYHF